MDKKGVIKASIGIGLFLALVALIITSQLSRGSLSNNLKETYVLGEKIKLDLRDYENYSIKITTPSTSYISTGRGNLFVFSPHEAGHYRLEVVSGSQSEIFEFEVVEGIERPSAKLGEIGGVAGDANESGESKIAGQENNNISSDGIIGLSGRDGDNALAVGKNTFKNFKKEPAFENPDEIVIGQPVFNKLTLQLKDWQKVSVKVPYEAYDISVKEELASGELKEINFKTREPGLIDMLLDALGIARKKKEVVLAGRGRIYIRYFTPGPSLEVLSSRPRKKVVRVRSPEALPHKSIRIFTDIGEVVSSKREIKVYWKEKGIILPFEAQDTNGNGLIDRVEWVVDGLGGGEQTFEIIVITKAEHLDENRTFISDIYNETKSLDGIWSETIPDGHYVRVEFERKLTSENDITVFPRVVSGNPRIEVYEENGTELIAEFQSLNSNEFNRVVLSNLANSQSVFDLRVVGGSVEFDYIVDPVNTAGEGLVAYAATASSTVYWRFVNPDGSVGTENTLASGLANAIAMLRMVPSPTNSSEVLLLATDIGNPSQAKVFVFNNATQSWDAGTSLTTNGPTFAGKAILYADVAYEQQSGEGLVVYGEAAGAIYYKTWNGTWSAQQTYTTARQPHWLTLKSDPTSDKIMLVYESSTYGVYSSIWNGTAWGTEQNWGTSLNGAAAKESGVADGAWEGTSGDGMVLWIDNTGAVKYATYTNSTNSWGTATTINGFTIATGKGGTLRARGFAFNDSERGVIYGHDRIVVVASDGQNKVTKAELWDGSAWSGTWQQIGTQVEGGKGYLYDMEWETNSSIAKLHITFTEKTDLGMRWVTWDTTNGWSTSQQLSGGPTGVGVKVPVDLAKHSLSDKLLTSVNSKKTNIGTWLWNYTGGSWGSAQTLNTGTPTGKYLETAVTFFDGRNAFIDSVAPNVTLLSPPNNSVDTDGQILFEYNVTDNVGVSSCSLVVDNSVADTDTTITEGVVQNFTKALSDGLHNWTVNCTDASSNSAIGEIWIINVSLPQDNSPPVVTLIAPPNNSVDNDGSITFTYNVTDNLAIANCSLYINGQINATDTTITEGVNQTFDVTLLDGDYLWKVSCVDNSANANVGNSTTWNLSVVETQPPSITLVSPVDFYNSSTDVITFNYNATDISGISNCSLYINGVLNKTDTNVTSGALETITQSFADGSYNWSIGCYDASPSLNFGFSTNRTFNVSTPYCIASDFNFSSDSNPINHVGSWAVRINGWATADDSQAQAGKNPEDTATTTMFDFDYETDGSVNKLKLKDKAANDGQWLKIDTGIKSTDLVDGDIIIRIVGADLKGTNCAGKQTWTNFNNVIVYPYINSTAVNASAGITVPITNALISTGCVTPTSSCTVDAVEVNITDLFSQTPSGQNFTIRVIADAGHANKEIPEVVDIYIKYSATPDNTGPNITLIAPPNNSVDTDGQILFEYNVTDNAATSSCSLIIDNSVVDTDTSITDGVVQNFTKVLSDGVHNWSINCTDINSNTASSETWIINVSLPPDNSPPVVTLIAPPNGTTDTDGFFEFTYNVTDNLAVEQCSLIVDGEVKQTDQTITESVPQYFNQSLRNGLHSWSVNCTDNSANANVGNSTTWYVNASAPVLQGRWYESSTTSYTSSANINLSQSQDVAINDVSLTLNAGSLVTMDTASSPAMGNNGVLIGASTTVSFSGYFTAGKANKGYITWKAYITNSSGDTLICKRGDDSTGGVRITSTAGTFTGSCTAPSSALRLAPSDRLKLVVNIYNSDNKQRKYTHEWDSSRLSYMDIASFKSLGFLEAELVDPLTDPAIGVNEVFNMTCQVRCADGNCTNTQVYAQYNSGSGWQDIGSSGSLVLNTGTSNPQNLGEIDSTYQNVTFEIKGSSISTNTIRCAATSTYSNYNGTTTTTVTVGGGANAPSVILVSPANNTFTNSTNLTLIYNATDVDLNIANATLILNGQPNITNQSAVLNGEYSNFTLTNLADGFYNWSVNVTDLTNLVGSSETWTFTIDTQAPTITLYNPLANESIGISTVTFNFSVSDNIDTTLTCDLIVDSSVLENDFSAQNGSFVNFTETIGAGFHLWNVTCLDDAGNLGASETRNFTITDEPPTVALITANNTFTTTGNITLIYNATDNNGLVNATLILNGQPNQTNQSAVLNGEYSNFTLTNLAEGVYTWDVNVTDTGGFTAVNGTPRTFTVDLNVPNVTLNLPANNTQSNSSTVDFNFTVTDSVDTSLTCNLYVGEVSDTGFSAANGSLTNRQITGLTDGEKLWNVTCSDDAGNLGASETRLINITEYPTIALNTANNSFFNTSTFNLSYTPSDNTNLSRCDLYIDNVLNQTNSSAIANGQENNFTVQGISEGAHTWYVTCFDLIGLQNTSETRTFTVDLGGPNITLLYPPAGIQLFTDTVNFSYNATDNIDTTIECNITVNSEVVDSHTATSGAITNRTVSFSQGGFKLWNVTCIDSSQNIVTSETRNFTLAFAPVVNLTLPANGTAHNSSTIILYYNVTDDNDNIANATLILNGQPNQTNQSAVLNGQINNFTLTNLADGFYNWSVNVTDLTNLVGSSETWTFTIDTHTPLLTINGPLQGEIVTSNNVTLNFTVTDNLDTVLTCNITVDDFPEFPNINASNGTDTLRYMLRNDGNYTWDVRCWDDAGNINQSAFINFTVKAPPNVTLDSPADGYRTNSSDLTFVYTPLDAIGITQCELYIDDVLNQTDTTINKNQQNSFSVQGIAEGAHNWTVNCTDPDGNSFEPTPNDFQIDRTPPAISLSAPSNGSIIDFNQGFVRFNWTATDALDTNLTCNLTIDSVVNQSFINVTSGVEHSVAVNNFAVGLHLWNVTCWDSVVNNTNISETWQFNVTYVDFMVNETSIVFNVSSPVENESVMINATVYNLVNVTAKNITVQFFDGNPDSGGTQIGTNKTITQVGGLSSVTVSTAWYADLGTSDIFVIVDPPLATNGSFTEWNESNNNASRAITVGAWHFVVGDISGLSEFALRDIENSSVVRWPADRFSDGNIYAADSE
ncbi:hypothetical protein D6817_01130, partial [Candidatus Pacearchaeota archaeon]